MAGDDLRGRLGYWPIRGFVIANGVWLEGNFLYVGNRGCRFDRGVAAGGICDASKSWLPGPRLACLQRDCATSSLSARRTGRRFGLWGDHCIQYLRTVDFSGRFSVERNGIRLAGLADQWGLPGRCVNGQSLRCTHRSLENDACRRCIGTARYGDHVARQRACQWARGAAVVALLRGGAGAVDQLPYQFISRQ